ncbi:DNA-directed RNA polymerase subunit alpha C-terminal domain-containing protein [Flavobacterium soyae]|uniref:DNA-directed RNA polymerase subunit alpha C-terminal domain-containing protein n=1 Tax=Flavobacterium soyae TaxID=2903098 RepID=A0ABZ2UDE0_9FLAO
MTIDEIYKNENLSVRSYHACKYSGLDTLGDIIKFYQENSSFDKLRNCGKKSNEELIELYNKYKNTDFGFDEIYQVKIEDKCKTIISELSRNQREVINSFIQINTNSLSIRSQNAIKAFLEDNLKIKNFADKILFADGFDIKKIRNVGARSVSELEVYINLIEDFIVEVSKNENDKYIISLKNKFLIQKTFSLPFISYEILESESIFQLINYLINQNALYDINQTKIFRKAFKIYHNAPQLSLDDIAQEVNLTRERVRQVRKIILEELFNKLLFIRNFNDNLLQKYNIDNTQYYIDISDTQVESINIQNKTNFTKEFITYIIYSYWSCEYELVGNCEDVIQPKFFIARNRHNWNNFYLVKKELVIEFDFVLFANDINGRLSDRIEETYSFSFKSYLSNFLVNDNLEILNSIMAVAEKMVNQEFEIYIDLEDNLIFERNSSKSGFEYSYEALQQLGKPSKVNEITQKIIELYPYYETDDAKVRATLKRINGFVPIGRKSVFGLKKWEEEFENFKGGTIRQITEDFLHNVNEPKHISEIAEYVIKFRSGTYERSILDNLKADESGLFVFYKDSTVGLSYKKYDTDIFIPLSSLNKSVLKTWEESFILLREFIDNENRLPYSCGCPEEEIQLYRWYNVQRSKIDKGKLDSIKVNFINSIINQFDISKKRRRLGTSW